MGPDTYWGVYESNVQAYRGMFFSSQSIMLAVGAITLKESWLLTGVLAALSIFQIWFIWYRVIRSRCLIVDYHKFDMKNRFTEKGEIKVGNEPALEENTYVSNKTVEKK